MANVKVLNKDPFTYGEERRRFLEDLQRFHTTRATPFNRIPQIGGREIDLYRLYRTVTELGGWQKVNNELLWEDIQEDFGVPVACTNGAQALKYIYFRYLNIYEKVHFLGLDPDNSSDEQEEGPARKKICLPVESIPLTYNYSQHKVHVHQREANHLSTDLARLSDYDKLEMSLRSGLPNEVDFAVNVCLLLSNEGRYVLKLNKSLQLLPLLMANIGIFEDGYGTMEDVMTNIWRTSESKRDFLRFWHDVVKDEKIRENIRTKNGVYKRDEMVGSEVLHLGRDIGVRDAEGQRVLQLAMLIRNLSFEDVNQQLLASSSLVFRFLMLCVHSSYGSLRQLALDTLGNLAAQMVLQPVEATATQLIINLIKKSLADQDKFVIVRALEMLSKLCQLEKNEAVVKESLEGETYCRIVQLLTVHDIQLIVHTLEALYQLSELGETTTTMIAQVKQAVDLLVNLITVEAQSYGPNSLIGIKVVEYVPPADPTIAHPASIPQPSRTVIQSIAPGQAPGLSAHPSPHLSAADQARSDVEVTASNWLQGTYETKKGSCTKQSDLFAEYQQFCCKFGIADTLTATDLVRIAKSAIPQAKITEVDKGEGHKETLLKGLSKRAKPKPFAILAGSDKVYKPSACNVPVNPLRSPGPANWLLNSDPLVAQGPIYTPTLRQRLMEPPQMPPLQQALIHYAGATGAGAPPSARPHGGRGHQGATPKPGGGGKKRATAPASPAPPSGPGPGPGGTSPHPTDPLPSPARPTLIPHQQLQVAGAPQTAVSVLQAHGGEQILIQASPSSLIKPACVPPPTFTYSSTSTFTSTSLSVSTSACAASSVSASPGQQFPTIHQALQGDVAGAGKTSLSVVDQGNETGFIKSLLAKKVCQNMVRLGNPSQSPPPQESQSDSALPAGGQQSSLLQADPSQLLLEQKHTASLKQLPVLHPQLQLKPSLQADQTVNAVQTDPGQQQHFPVMVAAQQQQMKESLQQETAQHPQLPKQQEVLQQPLHPSMVHQQAVVPGPRLEQQQTVPVPTAQQQAAIPEQHLHHVASHLPGLAHPLAMQQQKHVLSQPVHQQTQVAQLPQMQQQQADTPSQMPQKADGPSQLSQQSTFSPHVAHQQPGIPLCQLAQQSGVPSPLSLQTGVSSQVALQTGVPSHLAQQTGVSSHLAQQQQPSVPSQPAVSSQYPQQQQINDQPPMAQQWNGQSQKPMTLVPQSQTVQQQQASEFHSQSQLHPKPSISLPAEQNLPQQIQSQVVPAPAQNPSQFTPALPSQSQGSQTPLIQAQSSPLSSSQVLQAQQNQQQIVQGQPQQLSSQGVQVQTQQTQSQGVQAQPQQSPPQTAPGQAHSQVNTQAQPHGQQVVHVQQGHQVIVHQHAGHAPQQIHIQQRVPGQQQLPAQQVMLQGNPPQQVHVRPAQQQIIVQQQQNHVVIQGQSGLQKILHQPVQQLHIQPTQQLHIQGQGQLHIQGQNQQLRIQTQAQQPVVIQLPMYQLSQITSSQTAGSAASLPSTLVQTTTGGLVQSTMMPYRAIIPHQSASVVSAVSSHRPSMPDGVSSAVQATGDHAETKPTVDSALSEDSAGASQSQTLTVQSCVGSSHPNVCNTPSHSVGSEGRAVTPGLIPSIPATHTVHTQWSAGSLPCRVSPHPPSYSSSSTIISQPAPASSSFHPSSSSSVSMVPSSSMSITQAILSGQQVQRAGSSPLHSIRVSAESHPHLARDNGHTNGSSSASMSAKKDCNGLGEVNGGLGSPDSASNDMPPSPMGGVKSQDHIPNGLLQASGNSWKEGGQLSKELLYNMAEKMGKINGVAHHLENGDAKISVGQNTDSEQDCPVSRVDVAVSAGEEMEVDVPRKQEVWHVNGLNSGPAGKENHAAQTPGSVLSRPGQVLVKQTSMEEVSLDSTDSRLVVNCSRAGEVGVRPLFSPNSSHDSDVSCDSFASSLTDSVSSDKHSNQGPPFFPRPSASSAPSPSSSCSAVFPEVPLVLAGTIPKSEAANKRSKKKATPKPKAEKPPPKSKKRKGGKNTEAESPTQPAPAKPLVMEYMCEWAGCGRCFDNARLVYLHATKTHVPALPEVVCQWHGCEPLRRKRWSLVTHLQDHHCSEMAQRAACQRRFQAAQTATAASSPQAPTPLQQAPALVYPPDAAMQAIRRFHIKPPFAEFVDQREGPVTKHIRLTAALILRNLSRYSSLGRSLIKHRERQLSYVTMSACESSTALSSCLWEILHDT